MQYSNMPMYSGKFCMKFMIKQFGKFMKCSPLNGTRLVLNKI